MIGSGIKRQGVTSEECYVFVFNYLSGISGSALFILY
jgi:hypothetical protein